MRRFDVIGETQELGLLERLGEIHALLREDHLTGGSHFNRAAVFVDLNTAAAAFNDIRPHGERCKRFHASH